MRSVVVPVAVSACIVVSGVLGLDAGPASGASKEPVKLEGTVNVHGTKDVSAKSKTSLTIELDDRYFTPTFVKAKPGEKVTVELENAGGLPHTFTSDDLGVDEQLAPGDSVKVKITVPAKGASFRFSCRFHQSSGMQGAVFTKGGAAAKPSGTNSGTSPGTGSYGY